jgi:small basic protein
MLPLLGLLLGLILGLFMNVDIPSQYSTYVAVAILATIDSIMGAVVADMKKEFNVRLFVTGLLGNGVIAVAVAALGDQLNLPLNLAAVFAFGNRIFLNFSVIRRLLLERYDQRREARRLNRREYKTEDNKPDVDQKET